ncbi:hypothetical protein ABL78_7250 [Leptomonas seymouri]|uniref:Uncharacterized protein n=1 Tax=Leptomonas seymouri TaxID=5684 RepID=A0A0N0P347_LEPSE|nr:hypothetical protein ABL78_7250 [Leptomonas seymouri]|eukprot:KPI83709.1 hypothetical protein ABL78_7250 [Leptomonas seymouri]
MEQSNRSSPEGSGPTKVPPPVTGELAGDAASASHSRDDFTVSPSMPTASLLQAPLCIPPFLHPPAGSSPTEVLLGFESYQLIVPVTKAETSQDSTTLLYEQTLQQVAVFPWLNSRSGGEDVRTVRVQTQLRGPGGEGVMAASNMFSVRSSEDKSKNTLASGAQWLPLISRIRSLPSNSANAAVEGSEDGCVVGEVLVRWNLIEPPSSMLEGGVRSPSVEDVQLRWLAERYCGGPGAPCSYAVLGSPFTTEAAAARYPSLASGGGSAGAMNTVTGGEDGSLVDGARSVGEAVGKAREGTSSVHFDSLQSLATSHASLFHSLLSRCGPVHHSCVYLLLECIKLRCAGAHARAWQGLATHAGSSSNGGEHRFRLEVRVEWPADWPASWLCTIPSLASRHESKGETNPANLASTEANALSHPHAGAFTIWMDVSEGSLVEDSTFSASADDYGAERTLKCMCMPLCLPMPSPKHVQLALGLPGLTVRFRVSFRLFALNPSAPADVPQEDSAAGAREKKRDRLAVCLGAGATLLSMPLAPRHKMTSLLPPKASNATNHEPPAMAVPLTKPLFLFWRARLSESMPLQQTPFLSAGAKTAGSAILEGMERSQASLSMPGSALATQEVKGDSTLLHHRIVRTETGGNDRCRGYAMLAHLTVSRIEMLGVDMGLACGTAQRHRQTLAPAAVALLVGGGEEEREENTAKAATALSSGDTNNVKAADSPASAGGDAGFSVPLATSILLTPSLSANAGCSRVSSTSPLLSSVAPNRLHASCRVPKQRQQRYKWATDVCLRSRTQLALYVCAAEANLRAARGEEMWSTAELRHPTGAAGVPDGCSVDRVSCKLIGKAVYMLDSESWTQIQRSAESGQVDTREVLLDLVSPIEGRWMGRLWLEVSFLAADTFPRDPRGIFLSTCVSLQVSSCKGLVVGDVALARRMESSYQMLRRRVREEYERRGRVPHKLRQHVKEVRHLRRHLDKQGRCSVMVRLVCVSEGSTNGDPSTWASQPFQLPSALSVVRGEVLAQEPLERSWGAGGQAAKDTISTSASGPLLTLSQIVNDQTNNDSRAAVTRFELRSVSLRDTSGAHDDDDDADCNEGVVAVGHARLPLRVGNSLPRAAPYAQNLTVPLTLRTGGEVDQAENAAAGKKTRGLIHPHLMVANASSDTPGALTMTATWSLIPARGDTYVTCLLLEVSSGRCSVERGYCHWILRWVYVFESSDHPEVEHAVDVPLSLQPSSPQPATQRAPSPADVAGVFTYKSAGLNSLAFWSGATTRLPRVGSMGATLRRVELLEATPVASTVLSEEPQAGGGVYTMVRLAMHTWTDEDELQLRARQQQSQHLGGDVCMWLSFTSTATGGRQVCHYRFLLGLYSSNAVAQYEMQRLERRMALAGAKSVTSIDGATHESRFQSQDASQMGLLRFSRSPLLRTQAGVGASDSTHSAAAACRMGDASVGMDEERSTEARRGGGVVMRTVLFRCADSALTTAGLTAVVSATCRIVRDAEGGGVLGGSTGAPGGDWHPDNERIVLDAGPATRVLQTHSSPSLNDATDTSTPQAAVAHVTATWTRTDYSRRMKIRRCAKAGVSQASHLFQQPIQGLLRLDIPTRATAEGSAFHQPSSMAGVASDGDNSASGVPEVQLCVEVCVGDGDSAVRYVSDYFSARSVLCAAGRVKLDRNAPLDESECASWTMQLNMHRAATPSAMAVGGPTSAAAQSRVECGAAVAEVEMLWGLDLVGVQSALAAVPCLSRPSASCRNGETAESRRREAANAASCDREDESTSEGGDHATLQQVEGYSAWSDFFATLRAQEQLRNQQAHLRHWRLRIVGIEVEGLELPVWAAGGVGRGGQRPSLTTILAQLNFSTKPLSGEVKPEEVKGQAKTASNVPEDSVLGVTRAVAVSDGLLTRCDSMQPNADHGDAANAPLLQRQRVLTGEVEPNRSLSSRRARAYRVSFAPSAWCIALHDIMRHRRVAAHRADEGTGFEDGARSAAASPPPPELTLWQLLTPTAAAAFAAATHEVYELGAVQLSSLFHECALFLVQVLARWCSGACTLEERDTVLRATASFPSHWMPLDAAASPAGAGSALMGRRDGVPRVRFFYSFLYDGPQCPAATAFPGMQPTTSPGVVSVVPPTVPVPTTLADAVYCAQLDHAQLEYQKLSSAAEGHTSLGTSSNEGDQLEDAAINWLSHVVLEMRVVLTTVNAADEGSVIDSHVVARWATRLAPLPSLPRPKPKSKVPPAPVMPPMQATVASPLRPVPVPVPIPVAKPEGSAQPPSAATRAAAPELAVAALALREPAVSETTEKKQQLPSPGGSSAQPQPTKSAAPMSTAAVPAIPTKGCFCWQPSPIERSKRRSSSAGGRQGSAVNTAVLISIEMELRLLPADSAAMATLSPNLACARGEREGHEEGEVVGRSHVFLGRTQASALRWDRAEERLDEGWRLIAPLPVRIPVKASFMLSSTYLHTQVSSRSCGVAVTDAFGAVAPSAPTAHVSFDLLAFTAPSWSLASALEAAQQASNQRQLRALATLKRAEARLLAAVASSTSPPASPSSLGPRAMPSMSSYAISSPSLQRQERLSAAFAAHPCRILRVPPAVYRLDTFTVLDVIKQIERQNRVAESDKLQDGQSPWFALLNMPESDDGRTSAADSREGVVCRKACLVSALTGEVRMLTWRLLPSLTDTAPREVFCGSDAHQQSPLSWLRMPAGRLLIQERARLRFEWCRSADPCPVSSLVGIVGGASISYTSTNGNAWLWVSGGLRLSSIPLRETALNAHAQQLKDLQMCAARSEAGLAVPSPPHCIFTANTWKPSPHRRRSQVPSLSAFADAEVPTRVPTLTAPYYQLYASHCLCQQSTTSVSIDAGSCMPARRPQWKCDVDVATPASLSTPSRNASFRLFHTATKLSDNRVWLLGGWCVANNSAVLPATEGLYECPPTTVTPVNAGLVERRRSEVRHAASTLETAALRWCETVGCMRCMVDGTPAPPVEVILEAANADSGDAATASGCTQAQRQPRVACHVAAACGPRHVVLFGGLVPDVNGPLRAASATADLHTYDTVQGAWARLSAPQGAQLWPMARYGHSCAVVPGTGGTQPSSCFVFGGATTIRQASESVAKGMCELVPPEELLWIWTPFVDIGGRAQCTWRRVQVPADMPSPLTGRFLPQLLALSAAEVLGADAQASPEAEAMDMQGPADRSVPVAAPDVGLTSLVLCVAGGMSKRPMMARASKLPSGVSSGGEMPASKTKVEGDALDAFRQCVEPWLQCPASGVTAVLLTSMCERLAL